MSIGRDSLSYWTSQITNFFFSLVTSIFVARYLGRDGRGLFTGALLANTLMVNLTNCGLQTMGMYFVGREKHEISRIHTLLILICLGIALVDFAFLLAGGEALRERIFEQIEWGYLAASLSMLPFALYYFAAQGVMTGLGRVRELSNFLMGYSLVMNIANIAVLVFAPWKVEGLLAVAVAGQVAGAGCLFMLIRKAPCRWVWLSPGDAMRGMGGMLSYGMRAFFGNFATSIVNRSDHVFISSALGNAGLGVYGLAARLAELVYYPSASLENAGYRQVVTAERSEAARLVQDLFRTNFLINGAALTVLVLLADRLVVFFYREEFSDAVLPLRILLPGTLFLSCSRMLALYFSAQLGKPQIPSMVAWIALAANVPSMWWFVAKGHGGLLAAAWVTTGCYALMLAIFLAVFASMTGLWNPAAYIIPQSRDWARLRRLTGGITALTR